MPKHLLKGEVVADRDLSLAVALQKDQAIHVFQYLTTDFAYQIHGTGCCAQTSAVRIPWWNEIMVEVIMLTYFVIVFSLKKRCKADTKLRERRKR